MYNFIPLVKLFLFLQFLIDFLQSFEIIFALHIVLSKKSIFFFGNIFWQPRKNFLRKSKKREKIGQEIEPLEWLIISKLKNVRFFMPGNEIWKSIPFSKQYIVFRELDENSISTYSTFDIEPLTRLLIYS